MTITCESVANNPVTVVAVGNLSISSNISAGATIYIRNSTTDPASVSYGVANTTPRTITGIQIDSAVTIKLTYAGYQDYNTTVNITSGDTTTLNATMTLSTGSVTFTSTPSGADIYLDTTSPATTHQTPLTGGAAITGLTPGLWYYKLVKAGYLDITGSLTINPGSNSLANTFSGSAYFSSTITGANIYLGTTYPASTLQGTQTNNTITGLTAATSGATTVWFYKIDKGGYTHVESSFTATAGQTFTVPTATMLTVANIVATGITVIPSSPCIEGTCSVTVNVTWRNMGQTAGSSNLSITVSGGTSTITPSSYPSVAFYEYNTEGDAVTRIFTVTGLDNAHSPHLICPSPNT